MEIVIRAPVMFSVLFLASDDGKARAVTNDAVRAHRSVIPGLAGRRGRERACTTVES